ncbi:hypothetical protein MVEN_01178100 [Mycena venus]|uniref:Uncharacterized protein n=1 Tax=Mycena venus TaxID=2733690 RepID=A0A8H7CVL3_9AGAR|nr:hypothetical protein MVEN_01178100 [Mycena venus]
MPLAPGTKESYLGAFLENIIYGVYLSAFIECCTIFRKKEKRRDIKQQYVVGTAVLMFILITTRCIIDTYRCVIAFDIDADFGPPNTTLGLVTNACWFFLTPIADAFIIFRTFIVWNRSWLVILVPMVLCLANLGPSIWVSIALAKLDTEGPAIWGNIVFKSLNLFLSLTLCTNIICTGFIAFRPTYTMRALSIIVESAAIYTLLLVGTLISNSVNSYVNFILFNCTPPTIGVVFSYIIIRVSRGTSYGERDSAISAGTVHFGHGTQTYELGQSTAPHHRNAGVVQLRLEREPEVEVTDSRGSHSGKQDAAMV